MNEYFNEKIVYYRLLLTFGLTAISGCFAWFFVNFANTDTKHLLLNLFSIIILFVAVGIVLFKLRYYIKQLKEK